MSARFGRNQRRKLREDVARRDREIARLESVARDHYDDKMRHLRERARVEGETAEWAARIVSLLGPESAFARELASLNIDAGLFQRLVDGLPTRLDCTGLEDLRPLPKPMLNAALTIVEGFACYAGHERDLARYRRRFEVVAPDGRRVLVMDDRTVHALRQGGDRELLRYLMGQLLLPWARGEVRP